MPAWSRRAFLAGVSGLGAALLPAPAQATLVRGLSLPALVARSSHVVLATPGDARSVYRTIGERRLIVTETSLFLEDHVLEPRPDTRELIVCTLGGQVGDEGELVHGQATFRAGASCLLFLRRGPDASLWVQGMAQGHYPISSEQSRSLLRASPSLPTIVDWPESAVKKLVGCELNRARQLVLDARAR
jgi:hypothetical protein